VIAHVGGVPLEEILPSVTGAGGRLLVARAWTMLRRERTFQAPAQAVFDAWIREEVIRR
jgi:hypothetical protein